MCPRQDTSVPLTPITLLQSGSLLLLLYFPSSSCRSQGTSLADYVLSRPNQNDEIAIANAIDRSLEIIPQVIAGDSQKAMNVLHTESE